MEEVDDVGGGTGSDEASTNKRVNMIVTAPPCVSILKRTTKMVRRGQILEEPDDGDLDDKEGEQELDKSDAIESLVEK
jgi:hypothetical protein